MATHGSHTHANQLINYNSHESLGVVERLKLKLHFHVGVNLKYNYLIFCPLGRSSVMIKVITAVVCAFAAILMIILSVSTTYWLQWQIASDGRNITHYRGLFRHCWESRDNVTNELQTYDGRTDCDGKFTDFKTGQLFTTLEAFKFVGVNRRCT